MAKRNLGNYNLYLFCTAVLFSLYDTVSTVMSVEAVGYSYEGNTILREIIRSAGITGFVGVKFGATLLALLMVYYIIEHRDDFGWKNTNLSVVYAGSSFYFLGLNSLQMSLILLFMAPLGGFILDVRAARKEHQVRSSSIKGIIARPSKSNFSEP